jgi:dipeptidase E
MQGLGFAPHEVDLRDYFGGSGGLAEALENTGLIWISGGNAFLLRRAMRQSGFDSLIHELLAADRLVYAGFSAAACCAGPTLRGLEHVDDPEAEAEGYASGTVWEGLGLIDRNIAVHHRSDHPEAALIERTISFYRRHGMAHVALRDGQALVVDGADTDVVG